MPPNVCLMWRAAGSLSLSGAIGQIIARHHRRLLSHHGDSATEPNRRQHSNNNHQNPATCLWPLLHSKSPPCRAGQIRSHDTLAQGHKLSSIAASRHRNLTCLRSNRHEYVMDMHPDLRPVGVQHRMQYPSRDGNRGACSSGSGDSSKCHHTTCESISTSTAARSKPKNHR